MGGTKRVAITSDREGIAITTSHIAGGSGSQCLSYNYFVICAEFWEELKEVDRNCSFLSFDKF